MLDEAARVTSPVGHDSNTWTHVGTVGVGIAALGVFTGGLSVGAGLLYIGLVGAGKSAGGLADQYLAGEDASEKIASGVVHVLLDPEKYQAANASEVTRTDEHDEAVKNGSDTVFIEGWPASRRGDATHCPGVGVIRGGSKHIFYGGAQTESEAGQYLGPLMKGLGFVIDVAGFLKKPTNAWGWIKYGLSADSFAESTGLRDETIVPEAVHDAKSSVSIIERIFKLF